MLYVKLHMPNTPPSALLPDRRLAAISPATSCCAEDGRGRAPPARHVLPASRLRRRRAAAAAAPLRRPVFAVAERGLGLGPHPVRLLARVDVVRALGALRSFSGERRRLLLAAVRRVLAAHPATLRRRRRDEGAAPPRPDAQRRATALERYHHLEPAVAEIAEHRRKPAVGELSVSAGAGVAIHEGALVYLTYNCLVGLFAGACASRCRSEESRNASENA